MRAVVIPRKIHHAGQRLSTARKCVLRRPPSPFSETGRRGRRPGPRTSWGRCSGYPRPIRPCASKPSGVVSIGATAARENPPSRPALPRPPGHRVATRQRDCVPDKGRGDAALGQFTLHVAGPLHDKGMVPVLVVGVPSPRPWYTSTGKPKRLPIHRAVSSAGLSWPRTAWCIQYRTYVILRGIVENWFRTRTRSEKCSGNSSAEIRASLRPAGSATSTHFFRGYACAA